MSAPDPSVGSAEQVSAGQVSAEQLSAYPVDHPSRWAGLRNRVMARSQLLVTSAYVAATSVVGVEVVAALLGVSALLPVTIPVILVSLTVFAVARSNFRKVRARRRDRIEAGIR